MLEWIAEGRAEGEINGQIKLLLRVLATRFPAGVPAELVNLIEKHQEALFRHWLLGLGSGDLTVNSTGPNPVKYEWPNVLRARHKLTIIQTMLLQSEVVRAQ